MGFVDKITNAVKQIVPKPKATMHISEATFNRLYPKAIPGTYKEISKQIGDAGCFTKEQQSMFLAQCAVESKNFTRLVENMNYSPKGLLGTFPRHFTTITANQYGRLEDPKTGKVIRPANQPMIGSIAYGNRMGNGNVASGDGWKYRGRGFIQITGKDNYRALGKALGIDLLENPDLLSNDLNLAVRAVVWYWNSRKVNSTSDVKRATFLINGGYNHLAERSAEYNRVYKA